MTKAVTFILSRLLCFYIFRKRGPLWNHEDVSAKNPSIKSAEQLTVFLKHVVSIFKQSSSGKLENSQNVVEYLSLQTA